MNSVLDDLIHTVSSLDEDKQRKVLEYAHTLETPKGIPFSELIARAEALDVDPKLLDEMEQAIEESCEQIDNADVNFDLFA